MEIPTQTTAPQMAVATVVDTTTEKPPIKLTRENQHKYEVFASIMERAVVAVDRADRYVDGSEPVRDCIRILDEATEAIRVALAKPMKKQKVVAHD